MLTKTRERTEDAPLRAAARLVASRIRNRLAKDSLRPVLTASIGVAVYPQDGETMDALPRTADRELYGMKPV
jgi:GGDEF domain-containing protein